MAHRARVPAWLSFTLKLAFGGLVVLWMIRSDKLDWRRVTEALGHWPELLAMAALSYLSTFGLAYRLRTLLRAQNISIRVWDAFSLSMIGCLFNTAIPGSVSGDVIKTYYIGKRSPGKWPQVIASVALDRVVGLITLLLIGSIAGLLKYELIWSSHILATLYAAVAGFSVTAIAALAFGVLSHDRAAGLLEILSRRMPFLAPAAEGLSGLGAFRKRPAPLLAAFAMTVPCQLLLCLSFYLAARALNLTALPLAAFLFIVPLGLTTTALPVAPAGIGVGQVAFYTLFQLVLGSHAGGIGSSLFTVYQFIFVSYSLTGVVFYLLEGSSAGMSIPAAQHSPAAQQPT